MTAEELLDEIKRPAKTDTEFMFAMGLIRLLEKYHPKTLSPAETMFLQMGVVVEHYNLNRKNGPEHTIVSAMAEAVKERIK